VTMFYHGSENLFFFKKPNPVGFGVFDFIGFFDFLFERAVGKFVG